jgi:hypothetical protein
VIDPCEIIDCIIHLNPNAKCSVFDDGTIRYGNGHTGIKPTLEDCDAVKSEVNKLKTDSSQKESLIQEKVIALAVSELKKEGKLDSSGKISK